MRRLLALVLVAGAVRPGRARQPSFSIHDDVLAYPQFEVVFSDSPIAETEALALVSAAGADAAYDAGLASQTDLTSQIRASSSADADADPDNRQPYPDTSTSSASAPDADTDTDTILAHTHHLLTLPSSSHDHDHPTTNQYLCSIPVLATPPQPNRTAAALARVEEARERDRASRHGWSIVEDALGGRCLYYMSGWWSYSYCYGAEVVQFHALPAQAGQQGGPVRDPQSAEYVLGRARHDKHGGEGVREEPGQELEGRPVAEGGEGGKDLAPPNSELAVKDNQRYLVQRLESGTLCDLTGRERTIEVQYHCHPGIPGDRIGWIKEVTTCTYLMVVQTPRLCEDKAFLPPKEGRAHAITCRPVGGKGEDGGWLGIRAGVEEGIRGAAEVVLSAAGGKDKERGKTGSGKAAQQPVTIGGVVIGGRKILGTGATAARLPQARHQLAGNARRGSTGAGGGAVVEVLAKGTSKADGSRVEAVTREQLERLDLSAEEIDELVKELRKMAGDNGWKLEVVEVDGEGMIQGVVEGDEVGEEGGEEEARGQGKGTGRKGEKDRVFSAGKAKKQKVEGGRDTRGKEGDGDGEEEEGSEEVFYRDEL